MIHNRKLLISRSGGDLGFSIHNNKISFLYNKDVLVYLDAPVNLLETISNNVLSINNLGSVEASCPDLSGDKSWKFRISKKGDNLFSFYFNVNKDFIDFSLNKEDSLNYIHLISDINFYLKKVENNEST